MIDVIPFEESEDTVMESWLSIVAVSIQVEGKLVPFQEPGVQARSQKMKSGQVLCIGVLTASAIHLQHTIRTQDMLAPA